MSISKMNVLDSLVMHLSRLNVSRDGRGQKTEFSNIGSSGDIDTLAVIVEGRISRGHGRREAVVHRRVAQLRALSKDNLADMVQGETRLFHRVGYRHSLEVAAMVNYAGITLNERVIGGYRKSEHVLFCNITW